MTGDGCTGTPVQRFAANRRGRDFVCGDIHGGWDLVGSAMAEVGFDTSRDRLFCVGDLIDRGEKSADFPDWLDAPWFQSVLGNHEQMALRAVLDGDRQTEALWWMNGGGWILDQERDQAHRLVRRLAELPLAMEIEGYGDAPVLIVHAALPDNDWPALRARLMARRVDPIEGGEPVHTLLWDRGRLARGDNARVEGVRHIFHGHTVVERVLSLGNRTYLDTGSVMTGRLTMLEIGAWLESGNSYS